MIAWGKMKTLQREVAEMPDKWYYRFAIGHPDAIRKVAAARNSPMLFRSASVIEAVNDGWGMENFGRIEIADVVLAMDDAEKKG